MLSAQQPGCTAFGQSFEATRPNDGVMFFGFNGARVRVVLIDGKPHGVGKDLCDVLEYADHTNAMKLHCKGVAIYHPLRTTGGVQNIRVLHEGDMLRLITHSALPAAERLERHVFDEILPCIYRHGRYPAPAALPVASPDPLQALLAQTRMLTSTVEQMVVLSVEQERQAAELDRVSSRIDRVAGSIDERIAREVTKAPLDKKPPSCEPVSYFAEYWNIRAGVPRDITRHVLTQLAGYRIADSGRVRSTHQSQGGVECPAFLVFQQSVVTAVMRRFLSECERATPDARKVLHPAFLGRKFELLFEWKSHAYTTAEIECRRAAKKDAREAAERANDMR
jgi:prophage antirepressor-like protein